MEQSQFDAQRRERRTGQTGAGLASIGLADQLSGLGWIDTLGEATNSVIVGDTPVAIVGGALLAGAVAHRRRRTSDAGERRRMLHASKGWITPADLRTHSGIGMARKTSQQTRPSMTRAERQNRRNGPLMAARMGQAISGTSRVRGVAGSGAAWIYSSFEDGVLCLGEPGAWKSAWLANQVLDHPGPALVTSTKPEFWTSCAAWRRSTVGPAWIFHPLGEYAAEDEFRWNLVRGCAADTDVAWARADALMESASAGGLSQAEFWTARARYLLAPLLVAADLCGGSLRDVNRWIQGETYKDPERLLGEAVARGAVEPGLRDVLNQMTGSSARPASGSAAQTASACMEFLLSSRLARTLCPTDQEKSFNFRAMIEQNGTLFLATGDSGVLAPIVSAIAAELRAEAMRMVEERRATPASRSNPRLDPPMAMIYDEASSTVPSVPVHEHAAQMRGYGLWHCVAVQNFAQVKEKWGQEAATTLRSSLQTHLVLALNDKDDREYYSERIGSRVEKHINTTANRPDTLVTRLFGNPTKAGHSTSSNTQRVEVPVFPPEAFSLLEKGQGLVVPARGHAAVVRITHGLKRAEQLQAKLTASDDVAVLQAARDSHDEQQDMAADWAGSGARA